MRGEVDRECRANGGMISEGNIKANVKREFHGAQPKNTPDDRVSRKRGGKVEESEYEGEEGNAQEGGEGRKKGGRVKRAMGGMAEGDGMKPSMGRAMRKRGGKVGGGKGADLHPVTHDAGVNPKGRKIMPEEEMKT